MELEAQNNVYSIRSMELEDVGRVHEIESEIFSMPWSEKSFADACSNPDNVYLVCECGGVIVGYCGMWTVLGEGNITNMAVDAAYRKRGVAQKMMSALHDAGAAKGVDTFFLEVRMSNAAATSLYEKMGYNEIGTRKRFYEKPVEDARVMSYIAKRA